MEGLNPREVKADFVGSLYAGQHGFVDYNLEPGRYVLDASAAFGDVDIRIYDSTRRTLLLEAENGGGDERLEFNIPNGSSRVISIKYSMFACINPFGACPVDVGVTRR